MLNILYSHFLYYIIILFHRKAWCIMNKKVIVIAIIMIMICSSYIVLLKLRIGEDRKELIKENQIEDYTEDAVGHIMKEYDCDEAIKAVSILVRTCYVYGKLTDTLTNSIDYIENMYNKNDKIDDRFIKKVNRLCELTRSQVITYKDEIIFPFFHYVSPLVTRTKDRKSGIEIPYLKKIACTKDVESKYFIQIKYYKKEELNKIIDRAKGDEKEVASKLDLRSNEFVIEEYAMNSDIMRVVSKGRGDGMGLCINDACNKANYGKKYDELINSYYKNIQIKKMYY